MTEDIIAEDSFSSDEELESDVDSEISEEDVDQKIAEDEIFDTEFFRCYSALKKRDDKIYDKNTKFFADDVSDNETDKEASNEQEQTINIDSKPRSRPKMTLLDHELANLNPNQESSEQQAVPKSYYERELDEIRNDIKKIGDNVDSDSEDDLFVPRNSTKSKSEKPKKQITELLDKMECTEDEHVSHLRQFWNENEKLTEEDKFLRDYILNKRYVFKPSEDKKKSKDSYFSQNLDELSDVDSEGKDVECTEPKEEAVTNQSNEEVKKIARIPRNSTTTIRDLVEKREKKEKRLKKLTKEKKKKKGLENADCEDIIGDIKTRFHYSETIPNDYGLSAQELLLATDEELEKWISLQETLKYKTPEEEIAQKESFQRKRDDIELKKKIFVSIYGESDGELELAEQPESTKRKRKTAPHDEGTSDDAAQAELPEKSHKKTELKHKKKHKRGLKHKKVLKTGVAPDRLLSYGLSKTKLKKSKLL